MATMHRKRTNNGKRKKDARAVTVRQLVQLAAVLQETFANTNQHMRELLAIAKLAAGGNNMQG